MDKKLGTAERMLGCRREIRGLVCTAWVIAAEAAVRDSGVSTRIDDCHALKTEFQVSETGV
jgi:hypothetical protein